MELHWVLQLLLFFMPLVQINKRNSFMRNVEFTMILKIDLEDADPLQFQHLVETVWDIFEKQVCEQTEATKMLSSAATTISTIGNYKQIEKDFNLGLLGEYVGKNEETLPFLATVMSHIHNQLERELQGSPSTTGIASHCAMTTFLKELEDKMGADDRTKNVVQEIAEMANQASGNLATGSPEFSRSLMEIGDTMRDSWKSLRDEVEKCIRHARKRNYSKKNMKHIYNKIICKGLSSAKNIQDKIDSVSASLDSWPVISTDTADQMNKKTSSPEKQGAESSLQISPNEDTKGGPKISSPTNLKEKPIPQISKEDAKGGSESPKSPPSIKKETSTNKISRKEKSNTSTQKIKPPNSKETSSAKITPSSSKEKSNAKMSSKENIKAGRS